MRKINKKWIFQSYEELADYIMFATRDFDMITVALKYEDTITLIKELMLYSELNPVAIEVTPEYDYGYDKEYYVSVMADDKELYVEPAYTKTYVSCGADLLLIGDGVSEDLLRANIFHKYAPVDIDTIFKIEISGDEDFDDDDFDDDEDELELEDKHKYVAIDDVMTRHLYDILNYLKAQYKL